ncbi:MAG: class I SAM-dependent methyltransferase [Acidobacteria bacterium]|nr:class I SAM-dependent methyltransferase [Acidobacteriota bacterium]
MNYRPKIYDEVTSASLGGDVEWYCAKALQTGGPVLELGAGTGRVTIPIAEAGIPIHALDADAGMLDGLRTRLEDRPARIRELVTVVPGNMRDFDLGAQFALVIAPFRAFLHNLDESQQRACLDCVRRHLVPGGLFAFNIFHPSLEYMSYHAGPLQGVWRWVATFDRPDGGFVMRSESNRYDTLNQIVHSNHRYDEYGPDGTLIGSWMQRLKLAYLYPRDVRALLSAAGFKDIRIDGDFNGSDLLKDTDELVIQARR